VNFPHNPTSAVADLAFFQKVVALAKRESLWVISDLAYADLMHDGQPSPSIFQVEGARDVAVEFFTVSKSYSMPGWRVGFCVGNRQLVGALTNIKGYLDYGSFAPVQLAAATALASCDGDVAENRAVYKHRAKLLCTELEAVGWAVPLPVASMFVWAPLPAQGVEMGSVRFASELLERARVAVSPGVGFGPGGEGFVRFALVEKDDRTRRACAAIGDFLARMTAPTAATPPHVDKAAGLK
jgi:alanine-synthesizing transaminase